MIPLTIVDSEYLVQSELQTSRTYKLQENKIQGHTDGMDALEQAIYKVLNTEKYEYPIYSFSYGIALEDLAGKDAFYTEVQLKSRIKECLLSDERVTGVDNFTFTHSGESMLCTFDVISIYGTKTITREVNI